MTSKKRPPARKPRARYKPLFLAQWRTYRNKTQAQLAEATGISVAQISRLENGLRPYTQKFLESAAEYLQAEPAQLINVDPTAEDGIWSIMETLQSAPADQVATVRAMISGLSFRKRDPGKTGTD